MQTMYTVGISISFALALVAPMFVAEADAAPSAQTTRYWDCCKPSGAWPGKAPLVAGPARSCVTDGVTAADPNAQSACNGGTSYVPNSYQPWAVNADLSYGFAAAGLLGKTESDISCACFALKFTSGPVAGKKLVVQVVSAGYDSGADHFDLMIPGGGVGLFNGCQAQWNAPADGWGARYGGVGSKADCSALPPQLRAGCNWRFDWFKNADNPKATYNRVTCPAAITAKSGCVRQDS